jgi:uncharacterized protein (TIGR03792 family)
MIDKKIEKGCAIECLVFEVKPDLIGRFIEMDHEYWTLFLKDQPGFISKEIWVNKSKPGEVTAIICWNSLEEWKSIPAEELIETDKKFSEAFGKENSKIVKCLHSDNELYKVREYRVKDLEK